MKRLTLLFVILSLFIAVPVMAMDGNELLKSCEDGIKMLENNSSADEFNAGACKGFILGSLQIHSVYTDIISKRRITVFRQTHQSDNL